MLKTRKLIIIGGKGNGTVLASSIEDINAAGGNWELLGLANDSHVSGDTLEGYPTLGKPEDVIKSHAEYHDCFFFYALIGAKVSIPRVARLKQLMQLGLASERFATLVHPTATISRGVELGNGVFVSPHTHIGHGTLIGDHTYIHNQCSIGRNSRIENYAYFAPQVVLGIEEIVEEGAYLGAACSTIERITIGAWSLIGMGSVVLNDVSAYVVTVGNPARVIGTVPYRWSDGTKCAFVEYQDNSNG